MLCTLSLCSRLLMPSSYGTKKGVICSGTLGDTAASLSLHCTTLWFPSKHRSAGLTENWRGMRTWINRISKQRDHSHTHRKASAVQRRSLSSLGECFAWKSRWKEGLCVYSSGRRLSAGFCTVKWERTQSPGSRTSVTVFLAARFSFSFKPRWQHRGQSINHRNTFLKNEWNTTQRED